MIKKHNPNHRMLFKHSDLENFLGEDPEKWFMDRAFLYTKDQIGFNLVRTDGKTKDRFDFPFDSQAIPAVLKDLSARRVTIKNAAPVRIWSLDAWEKIKGKPGTVVGINVNKCHRNLSDDAILLVEVTMNDSGKTETWWMREDEVVDA